jgi:HEAT repeat protein
MAGELDRAMGRLKHRDIRTRRRAVRTLVELEDPESLKAFKSLLNDQDSWFVSKALDAYRRWAPIVGLDAVEDLTAHSSLNVRRCGANLLDSLGKDGISTATMMLDDGDSVVRRKAAEALLAHGNPEAIKAMHRHANDAIRSLAMRHQSCTTEQLLNGLKDTSNTVQIESIIEP